MNQKLNTLFKCLVISFFILVSCGKKIPYTSNAELLGYDQRMCPSPCCGGLQINIDDVTNSDGTHFFLVYELPEDFSLGNNPTFPIPVKIDFTIDTTHCSGNYVIITRIAKR